MAASARGLAVICLAVPVAAQAQDATVLAVALAPPILLAPLATAAIRRRWLAALNGKPPSLAAFVTTSVGEFVLWLLAAGFAAAIYFQESRAAGLSACLVACGIVYLNRRMASPRASWRLVLGLTAVLPATWLVMQLAWYGLFLLWQSGPA